MNAQEMILANKEKTTCTTEQTTHKIQRLIEINTSTIMFLTTSLSL